MTENAQGKEKRISVAQALAEKSFLVKRIFDATNEARFVEAVWRTSEKADIASERSSCLKVQAEDAYRRIMEDIRSYQYLERAIIRSDASSYMETSRGRLSVAEALAWKRRLEGGDFSGEDLDFEENLCRKIRREYEAQSGRVKRYRQYLHCLKAKACLTAADTEDFIEENEMTLSDPLDILERIRRLTEENDRFLVELAAKIRLSNANTMIRTEELQELSVTQDGERGK